MKASLSTSEVEQAIAWNTAMRMLGAILAGPQFNYRVSSVLLSGDDTRQYVDDFTQLVQQGTFSPYWAQCLLKVRPRAAASLAILIVGFKQTTRPDGVDCGLCGAPRCEDFYRVHEESGLKALCPLELMTFCDAVSRGVQVAHMTYLSSLSSMTQSLGKAALALGLLDADFALGILLELGQVVTTAKDDA